MTRKPWTPGDDDPTLRIDESDPRSAEDLARTKRLPPKPQIGPAQRLLPRFETTGSFTNLRDRPPPLDDEPKTVKAEAVRLPPPPRIPGRYPSTPPIPPKSRPASAPPPPPIRSSPRSAPRVPLSAVVERPDPTLPILLKPRPAPPKSELARDDRTRDAPLSDPRASQMSTPRVSPSAPRPSPPIATPTPPPTAASRPPSMAPPALSAPIHTPPPRFVSIQERLRALPIQSPQSRAAAYGVAAALAVSILFSVILFLALRSDNPIRPNETPTAATTVAAPVLPSPAATPPTHQAAVMTCGLGRSGQLLARVVPGVPPMVAPAPGTARAAVGFASGRNRAEGIVVHLEDLTVERRFDEERNGVVYRVTPLLDRAPVAFAVDSEDAKARAVRTVPAQPPIRLGTSNFGIVRLDPGREPSVVWPGGNNEDNGEPAFATAERGTLMTFRRGRASGEVLAGWLSSTGTADTELGRVDAGAREVAAPAAAAGDGYVLIVFPARAQNERWHLRVAKAPRGKLPTGSQVLEGAASGTSDATAPAIAALPNGGWVVQWIESTASAKRLITQAYDERLVPAGLPVEIASGSLQEASGGLVYRDGRVLAAYLTMNGGTSELWGVVLRCG